MIIERNRVLEAFRRAHELNADREAACAAVAQALGVPVDVVMAVVAEDEVQQ